VSNDGHHTIVDHILDIDYEEYYNATQKYLQKVRKYSKAQYKQLLNNSANYRAQVIHIIEDAEQEMYEDFDNVVQPIAEEYSEFLKTL